MLLMFIYGQLSHYIYISLVICMSSLYEIVELSNGDVALRRVDSDESSDSLVCIKFSEESVFFLGDAKLDVARSMIEAGLDNVSEIMESDEGEEDEAVEGPGSMVH